MFPSALSGLCNGHQRLELNVAVVFETSVPKAWTLVAIFSFYSGDTLAIVLHCSIKVICCCFIVRLVLEMRFVRAIVCLYASRVGGGDCARC